MEHHKISSQKDLARRAGVNASTIARMLLHQHASQIDKIQMVARVFGLSAWQMLTPALDPSNPPVVQLTTTERDLYVRLRQAAEAFSKTTT